MIIYIVFIFGIVFLGLSIYSVVTRQTVLRSGTWITKDSDPARYWIAVVSYAVAGLVFAGFTGYILWLRGG